MSSFRPLSDYPQTPMTREQTVTLLSIIQLDNLPEELIPQVFEDLDREGGFLYKALKLRAMNLAYEGAKANADKMRQMHDKLVADIEELNARKATIKAKAAVAKTQSKVNEMTSAGDRAEGARSAFDRMEAKADEMLDRANAVAELSEKPADPTEELAKKYAAAGAEAAVDDDLARLKKEMGLE